jgi:hypothetical protein
MQLPAGLDAELDEPAAGRSDPTQDLREYAVFAVLGEQLVLIAGESEVLRRVSWLGADQPDPAGVLG